MHAVAHYEQSKGEADAPADGAGSTKPNKVMPERCDLIQRYLDEHPWITHCCILDDRSSASNDKLAKHFVKTDALQGLTQEKVTEALACLRVPISAAASASGV